MTTVPDVFISFTTADRGLAEYVRNHLRAHGLNVFLAPVSIPPGFHGDQAIWTALKAAPWVLVLASSAACSSAYVLQEFGIAVGVALSVKKAIIPVVWDIDPGKLPGWLNRFQAIDLREDTQRRLGPAIDQLANRVQAKKQQGIEEKRQQGALVVGAIVAGLALLGAAQDEEERRKQRRRRRSRQSGTGPA